MVELRVGGRVRGRLVVGVRGGVRGESGAVQFWFGRRSIDEMMGLGVKYGDGNVGVGDGVGDGDRGLSGSEAEEGLAWGWGNCWWGTGWKFLFWWLDCYGGKVAKDGDVGCARDSRYKLEGKGKEAPRKRSWS